MVNIAMIEGKYYALPLLLHESAKNKIMAEASIGTVLQTHHGPNMLSLSSEIQYAESKQ